MVVVSLALWSPHSYPRKQLTLASDGGPVSGTEEEGSMGHGTPVSHSEWLTGPQTTVEPPSTFSP